MIAIEKYLRGLGRTVTTSRGVFFSVTNCSTLSTNDWMNHWRGKFGWTCDLASGNIVISGGTSYVLPSVIMTDWRQWTQTRSKTLPSSILVAGHERTIPGGVYLVPTDRGGGVHWRNHNRRRRLRQQRSTWGEESRTKRLRSPSVVGSSPCGEDGGGEADGQVRLLGEERRQVRQR